MKLSAVSNLLVSLAASLRELGCHERAQHLSVMAREMLQLGSHDLAELEGLRLQHDAAGAQSGELGALGETLDALDGFLSLLAKPKALTAVRVLGRIANENKGMTIRDYSDSVDLALNPERVRVPDGGSLVDVYVDALNEAKHDPSRFPKVFESLSTDPRLNKDDIVSIASGFAFKLARSTSKVAALEKIWKMHNASETFAAKSRAMKGKSAA